MDPDLPGLSAQYRGGEGYPADGAGKGQKEPMKARDDWFFLCYYYLFFFIFVDYCFLLAFFIILNLWTSG
jgi:hypothetical protein